MLKRLEFVQPSAPVLAVNSPSGPGWIHEVKFDGWRAQFHKNGDEVVIYSRQRRDLTDMFPQLADSILCLPIGSAIIDAEITACDEEGKPDFHAIRGKKADISAYCFDVMKLDGADLRRKPLRERKDALRDLLILADDHVMRYSDEFPDPIKLLIAAGKMGLEGVVSKQADQPYVSGQNSGWVKVKTPEWRLAHANRGEAFQTRRRTYPSWKA